MKIIVLYASLLVVPFVFVFLKIVVKILITLIGIPFSFISWSNRQFYSNLLMQYSIDNDSNNLEKYYIKLIVPAASIYFHLFLSAYYSYYVSMFQSNIEKIAFSIFILFVITLLNRFFDKEKQKLIESNISDKSLMGKINLRSVANTRVSKFSFILFYRCIEMKMFIGRFFIEFSFIVLIFFPEIANKSYFGLPSFVYSLFK